MSSTIIIITPPPTKPKSHEQQGQVRIEIEVDHPDGLTEAEILRAAADQLDPPAPA